MKVVSTESHFSESYAEARRRFVDAATSVGATILSYGIDAESDEKLTIDVAMVGPDSAPAILVSSGVHGVEGFLGSALQHALLAKLADTDAISPVRYVFIHGVNPFGFAGLRRFNEDNIDLNRNFLIDADAYRGAPDGYASLNGLLNPTSPPFRFEPFRLKAIWNILRHGLQAIKQSVAGGQYEFPRGLFFGGYKMSQSALIVAEHCDEWIGLSPKIVHIDFHSGLGDFANYKLLLAEGQNSPHFAWYTQTFGEQYVEPLEATDGTAYNVSGMFGEWMQSHFGSREYRFVCAEFGTYDVIRVLAAIRAENRAHHYGAKQSNIYQAAKLELLECFCPQDITWRKKVVQAGLGIIQQAAEGLLENSGRR